MAVGAPLRVTVQILFHDGPARGQRLFRLSEWLELPPRLDFPAGLPLAGAARGEVQLQLPDGTEIAARALLRHDPERLEAGSSAELLDLPAEMLQSVQTYIDQRLKT